MEILDLKQNIISSITDWGNLFLNNPTKVKHWKVGRSAYPRFLIQHRKLMAQKIKNYYFNL